MISLKDRWRKSKEYEIEKTQFLDDFRNRIRYCELKEEAQDRIIYKRQFINRTKGRNTSYLTQVHGPANKQHTLHTHTHKQTNKQTNKHTHARTHTQTHIDTHTHTHTYIMFPFNQLLSQFPSIYNLY